MRLPFGERVGGYLYVYHMYDIVDVVSLRHNMSYDAPIRHLGVRVECHDVCPGLHFL